jgi:predicted nucleic acid-binding protein
MTPAANAEDTRPDERYVFDAEPLLAFLYDEAGAARVQTLVEAVERGDAAGLLASANAAEIAYLVARWEAAPDDSDDDPIAPGRRDVLMFRAKGVAIAEPSWETVARVKCPGGVSLADAAAVALAHDRDATLVVGGDDDFDELPVDVAMETVA